MIKLDSRLKDVLASQVPDSLEPRRANKFVLYVENLIDRLNALEVALEEDETSAN